MQHWALIRNKRHDILCHLHLTLIFPTLQLPNPSHTRGSSRHKHGGFQQKWRNHVAPATRASFSFSYRVFWLISLNTVRANSLQTLSLHTSLTPRHKKSFLILVDLWKRTKTFFRLSQNYQKNRRFKKCFQFFSFNKYDSSSASTVNYQKIRLVLNNCNVETIFFIKINNIDTNN